MLRDVRTCKLALLAPPALDARTVYRCTRDGSVSLSTAAEPGSRCQAIEIDDNSAMPFAQTGIRRGTLYRREQDGRTVYGTRKLPGSVAIQKFAFPDKRRNRPRALGKPRLDVFKAAFRQAASRTGTDEAWLRAIAHIESAYKANALSPKGARGIMQLMPATARHYQVSDPFDPSQSILAGARHLRVLRDLYGGDRVRIAAAYNAGAGAVKRYGGVPPYAETQAYVRKVMGMYVRYRAAMGQLSSDASLDADALSHELADALQRRGCAGGTAKRLSPISAATLQPGLSSREREPGLHVTLARARSETGC